jgi:indolepyruvate ferredoxin oxidoreductase, beta subunit
MVASTPHTISVLVCALGGEGGGVLARWLVDTAVAAGHAAQSTSIPGVAQRTGATTYYVEIASSRSAPGARHPVFSLYPVPGALDLLVSSELLETVRQIGEGHATRERTQVLSSAHRTLTTAEKMQLADGRARAARLLEVIHAHSREAVVLDMSALARQAGTVISAVMLGAIAGAGALPFAREQYEAAVRRSGKGVEASVRGFSLGYEQVRRLRTQQPSDEVPAPAPPAAAEVAARFPAGTHRIITAGLARLREYQDEDYARRYLQRLDRIHAAEKAADPDFAHGAAATLETARALALWMAFDDVIRVADLKSRPSRLDRVRHEVGAQEGDLLRVYDYLKPGAEEIAALLPPAAAARVLRWEQRRIAAGRAPFGFALALGTHRVHNLILLRLLAGLKRWRRGGSRFVQEQAMIERWLERIDRGLRDGWSLGHEIALCGRLVKGYGATNARGREALTHILDHLVDGGRFADPEAQAAAVREAREAALSDDAGRALDRTLAELGAPRLPLKPQPIVWAPRGTRPGTPGPSPTGVGEGRQRARPQ